MSCGKGRGCNSILQGCFDFVVIVPNCFETCAQPAFRACGEWQLVIPFAGCEQERIMALRRIGQEALRFGAKSERQTSLDELCAMVDFMPAERVGRALSLPHGREGLASPGDFQGAVACDLA